MLVELLISIAIVYLIYQRWTKRDIYKLGKQLNSGVRSFPFLGHSYLFLGNNQTLMKAFQHLGDDAIKNDNGLTSMWHGNYLYTMIAEPEAAELILKSCLEKDDNIMKMAAVVIDNGSIFAPVSIWSASKNLSANFLETFQNLKYFMKIFAEQCAILVQQIGKMAGSGPVAAWKFFTAYTIDAAIESTLGYQIGAQNDTDHTFLKAFDAELARFGDRVCQPWLHSDIVYKNLPVYTEQIKDKKLIFDFFSELITNKRKEIQGNINGQEHFENSSGPCSKTFLEGLIRWSGIKNGISSDTEIGEELMVLLIAGNTSAVAASFTSLMLSRYPEVQDKVYQELLAVFGDSDRPTSSEDLPRLKYLDAVIRETLRLDPPVPIITRKVEKEVVLPCGITLVPGTGVMINIWALHRNPRYWGDDAELFRPERFLDAPPPHAAAFMPFSHGPRNCVGYQFAMMSLKTVLSSVLRRFKLMPATAPNNTSEYPPLRLTFGLMMKDKDNYQIRLQSRSKAN